MTGAPRRSKDRSPPPRRDLAGLIPLTVNELPRGIRHHIVAVLTVVVFAVLAGVS
jgi:hypothetical protein